jgi:hypothetical protein
MHCKYDRPLARAVDAHQRVERPSVTTTTLRSQVSDVFT